MDWEIDGGSILEAARAEKVSGSRGVENTLESSLDMKDWRELWESTELDIEWDMEGVALGIGVFNMTDEGGGLYRGGGRFGLEEVDERL